MLGQTVKEHRLKKGLTQARLARLAGVSRRHLAALEKGANVSVLVLRKVASVLDLNEIQLDSLSLRAGDPPEKAPLNVPLLADALREARADATRAEAALARLEGILGLEGGPNGETLAVKFPPMPVRHLDITPPRTAAGEIRDDRPDWKQVETAGELRQGEPVDESAKEMISLPATLIENGEIVFRARGDALRSHGIENGDVLIVELRPRGRAATGELVIARIGKLVFVGRWWQKHGRKSLLSDGLAEVTVGRSPRALRVMAAV
ncbi:MAG TPA: helix-turn-helix domain-containing protein, partial [Thermoanaerobaculia bacterium]|nr:helix-turn-helix domain-containing protein [Thermoanaerobaculia bacterium]